MIFTPSQGTKRGTEFPCPAGTYNNRTGLERKEDCVPCITGHYCPQGTTNPKQCPRGTFNDVLSAKVPKKTYLLCIYISCFVKINCRSILLWMS